MHYLLVFILHSLREERGRAVNVNIYIVLFNRLEIVQIRTGCNPIMFWMVVRHGARYPAAKDASIMKERVPNLRKRILQNHKEKRGNNREITLNRSLIAFTYLTEFPR